MKKIALLIMMCLVFFACSEKQPPQITIPDTNQDGYWAMPSGSSLGPTSLGYIKEHQEITIRNHSGTHMGFDLRSLSNLNIPVVAVPFIHQGDIAQQRGVILDLGVWYRAISVFYKAGLGSLIIQTIQLLGLDFINQIEDWMVDSQYEAEIRFTTEIDNSKTNEDIFFIDLFEKNYPGENLGPKFKIKYRNLQNNALTGQLKENSKNETFKKAVLENRNLLEQNGINTQDLLRQADQFKKQSR